jgi:FdhE protein
MTGKQPVRHLILLPGYLTKQYVQARENRKGSAVPINPFVKLRPKPRRPDVEEALAQLTRIAEQHPDLATLAALHAILLRTAFEDVPQVQTIEFDRTHAATKLAGGVPLLRGEALPLNAANLRERYLRLCDALTKQTGPNSDQQIKDAAQALKIAVEKGSLDIHALAMEVLAGDPQLVTERVAQFDLDTGLATTLLRWTLLPILEQVAKQLEPVRQQVHWEKGYCPTCGAWPTLAEQRGMEQIRVMRCGLCASEWQLERVLCPFCGTRAHFDIAFLHAEGQEASRRVMTCERCHSYLKQVTTLAPIATALLPVTDLATLHLDLVALDRAYAPPG